MTVLGGLEVNGAVELEVLDNDTRAEIKVGADNLDELVRRLGGRAVGVDVDGEGLGDTNGVGELDEGSASETGVDEGLCDPSGDVGGGAIDL